MWLWTGKNSAAAKARRRALNQLADQVAAQLGRLLDGRNMSAQDVVGQDVVGQDAFSRDAFSRDAVSRDQAPQKQRAAADRFRRVCSGRRGADIEAVLECWADLCGQQALASSWPEPPSGAQILALILDRLAVRSGAPADCPAAWPVLLGVSGQPGLISAGKSDLLPVIKAVNMTGRRG